MNVTQAVKVAGWGANSGLREVHVDDSMTIRLNDTKLEARSPGGDWVPLTLTRIPRSMRTALAELLAHPIVDPPLPQHALECRLRTGGACTCIPGIPLGSLVGSVVPKRTRS